MLNCVEFLQKDSSGGKTIKAHVDITPRDIQYFCDDESFLFFFYQFFIWRCKKYLFLITAYFFPHWANLSLCEWLSFGATIPLFYLCFRIWFVLSIGFLHVVVSYSINIKEAKIVKEKRQNSQNWAMQLIFRQ